MTRRVFGLLLLLLAIFFPGPIFAQQGQVINGSRTIYGALNTGIDSGSTDAYVITLSPPIPNYITGTKYTFVANTANTGACSLNIDAKGVIAIKVRTGGAKVDPANNAICAGQYVDVVYDGTHFQMISQPCTAASGGVGDALVANPLSQFATTTSAQLRTVLSDERGTSGGFASIDGILVVASGKTATINNTITWTATDGSSVALGGGGTVAYTTSNVATASAFDHDPSACPGGQFANDISATGVLTCATPAGGGDVLAVPTPSSNQLAIWASATSIQGVTLLPALNMPALLGDVTNSAGSYSTTITPGVVTLAKMANLATGRLIGRTTAGTGVPEALTVLPDALEPAHTGDVSNAAGSTVLTLATVNANVGSFTSGNFTVNAKGLITAAASGSGGMLSAVNPQTGTYQVLAADFSGFKTITVASGTFTITLVASGTQPAAGQYIQVINYGSGVVTIARSGQNINGSTASLVLPAASALVTTSAFVISDGTNYFAKSQFANPMTTAGDLIYGGASGLPTRLAAGSGLVQGNGASAPTFVTTLTGIRITPRAVTLTDAATVTPNADTTDVGILTTLSQTTTFANPTGTPTDGQRLELRVKSTTVRPVSFDTQYRGSTDLSLPIQTIGASLTERWMFQRNTADTKWDLVAYIRGY